MKNTKRILSLLLVFILLISAVTLTSCKKINRTPSKAEDPNINYISNVEIKDGSVFVTYSNDPDNPVNIGAFGADGVTSSDSSLKFFPLPSGTYGVTAGSAKYLEEVTIPETYNGKPVTTILDKAFEGAINLRKLSVPSSITNVGDNAFDGCESLEYNDDKSGLYLGNTANPYLIFIGAANAAITSCTVNEGTKVIYNDAFNKCKYLQSITLPANITSIGHRAFRDCNALSKINIPDKVYFIGAEAFYNCKSLKSVSIPTSVESIGTSAFYNCSSLATVTFPEDCLIKSIANETFGNCSKLTSIKIPKNVVSIGDSKITEATSGAFNACNSLSTVTFADSSALKQIGNYTFNSCGKLKTIAFPDTLEKIGIGAFRSCSLNEIVLPKGVTTIAPETFWSNASLSKVTLSAETVSINAKAFASCKALTSITIPATVTFIGENAFFESGLKTATIADAQNWIVVTSDKTEKISSTDFSTPATAATIFTTTYYDYQFYKQTT